MIKCMSLFSQILSEMSLSTVSFEQLVLKHGNDRNAKGFTSKAQLVAMIFSHLARADSLREITNGLLCCNGKASWNKSSAQTINACICKRTQERGSVRRILLETASAFSFKKYAGEEQ